MACLEYTDRRDVDMGHYGVGFSSGHITATLGVEQIEKGGLVII
jgi:hypothetical protein